MAARRGKRPQAKRKTSSGTPGWVWALTLVVIAAVAWMVYSKFTTNDSDGFLRVGPRPNPDAVPAPVSDADIDAPASVAHDDTVKPERPSTPQYDFYTLLPGSEVQMSDAELQATAQAEADRLARQQRDAERAAAALGNQPVPAPLPAPIDESSVNIAPPSDAQRALSALENRPAPVLPAPVAETAPAPRSVIATPAPAPATPVADTGTVTRYLLQAGAFGASNEAESTKARLAMAGLSARVEPAQINGNTVYRVRVGPYDSASDLAAAKAKLEAAGLQGMAIKLQ